MKVISKVGRERDRKELRSKKSLASIVFATIENIGVGSKADHDVVKWWAKAAAAIFVANCLLQAITMCSARTGQLLFECFSVLSFCCMGLLKLYSLRRNRAQWLYLMTLMSQLEKKHTANEKPDEEYDSDDDVLDLDAHIQEYTSQFESSSRFLARVYRSTVIGFTLSPFVEYVYERLTGGSPEYPHVLPVWAPLDEWHVAGYALMVTLELIAAVYCEEVHLAFDFSSAGLMIFAKGQFLLLRRYCENIAGKGTGRNQAKRDARAMCRIIYSHQTSVTLKEFVDKLGELLRNIMGIYYLEVTLTLCAVAMRLKAEALSATQMAALLQYMGATLTQLYLFCYYGDAMREASTVSLGQGPLGCAYWSVSPRVRRNVAMLSVGMLRPRRLRAGPFHYVDLPSFAMIVRAAYSYYAVLCK